ncbi:hypothetical protein WR164_14110 [Philodulcilactobacillus myokoensis]|uniref:Uncharacterized protein n=1 Tax=Philodulcilactobacillus myokoensis TaxID=2929573 RepID=A0A9W6B1X0_9LACO|nr:hypothetical protein [Philodulcilactobacillus myokoensis]GLB47432.1 hypothetical protein WR164_14110 [Philodulcilactobacillus myokoensis]
MPRNKLKKIGSQHRFRFTGIFVRSGFKSYHEYYSPTLLLKDVRLKENNQLMCDHLWFNYTKGFQKLGSLIRDDLISFDARVDDYYKGYINGSHHDYKLSRPTKIDLKPISNLKRPPLPIGNNAVIIGKIMLENKKFYLKHGRPYDDFFVDLYQKWLVKTNKD